MLTSFKKTIIFNAGDPMNENDRLQGITLSLQLRASRSYKVKRIKEPHQDTFR